MKQFQTAPIYFLVTKDSDGRLRLWRVYSTHRELLNDNFLAPAKENQ